MIVSSLTPVSVNVVLILISVQLKLFSLFYSSRNYKIQPRSVQTTNYPLRSKTLKSPRTTSAGWRHILTDVLHSILCATTVRWERSHSRLSLEVCIYRVYTRMHIHFGSFVEISDLSRSNSRNSVRYWDRYLNKINNLARILTFPKVLLGWKRANAARRARDALATPRSFS